MCQPGLQLNEESTTVRTYQIRTLDSGGTRLESHVASCSGDGEAIALARDLIRGGGLAQVSAGSRSVTEVFVSLFDAGEQAVVSAFTQG
jgi:predicted dinucleotide-binding enzyme